MKILEKLTSEQEAKMLDVRDFWLNYIFSCKNTTIDKDAAKVGIDWMYELAGYKKPVIIYVDSPMGCQYAVSYVKEIVKKIPQIFDENPVRTSVRASVSDSNLEFNNFGYYGGISDYGWVSFFDFFTQINVINNDKFNQFKNLLLSGIYDTIQLNGFCIVSTMPTFISRDNKGRLHNSETSAIKFKDGYELYYHHGVNVPAQWICFPETLTKEDIVKEGNAEKRRCLMEILGETKYAELLDLVMVDETIYNGRDVILFKTKEKDSLIDDYIYFVKVICPSTARKYYICVPKHSDALTALAWTFDMGKNEYQLLIET